MSEDITFCFHVKCKNTDCERNACHIKQRYRDHSFAMFEECEHWDVGKTYYSPSERRNDEQDKI